FLDESFFKCHRSYVINLARMLEVDRGDGSSIIMSNGAIVPLSRRRNKEFRKTIDSLFLHE
ncbi:MAG: LytTR family transcriptional regulator DNA-binding domain-containing protein, partial [Halanaerobiales bacterium]